LERLEVDAPGGPRELRKLLLYVIRRDALLLCEEPVVQRPKGAAALLLGAGSTLRGRHRPCVIGQGKVMKDHPDTVPVLGQHAL
jgi:hypothetical protein